MAACPESDRYRTLKGLTQGLYKEKGSKFLSFAAPAGSVEEAMAFVDAYRRQYHDARHCCYAYSIGVEQPQTRANDDGEPSGTAGRPILGQIASFQLHNVVIVVVRYFGGILLGTGGLTVAYKTAAAEALRAGDIVEKTLEYPLPITCDFLNLNEVMKLVKEEKLQMLSPVYDQVCRMTLMVPKSRMEGVRSKLSKVESLRFNNM